MSSLSVAFVWHMHQPLYKDRLSGQYLMPWVRLHALKDYLDMATILERFPRHRQTFNLVPSLLEQLIDYGNGAMDRVLDLTLMPVSHYGFDEKQYIWDRFFDLNWDRMGARFPRYRELREKRDYLRSHLPLKEAVRRYTAQEWLDLTVWFQLAWFDPSFQETDPLLVDLIRRGRDFTQADRKHLVEKQREIIRRIIPTYRKMSQQGQIELTTTPFYHPILPLLVDTTSARVARPGLPLPRFRFQAPEDAEWQVKKGLAFFEKHFGTRPGGMWPSEQSVSPEVIPMMARQGIQWAISDEGVLSHSIGERLVRDGHGLLLNPDVLYQPYRVRIDDEEVAMVFRDISLSDLIGFTYSRHDPMMAAHDLMGRLETIHRRLGGRGGLVTIALDGENCWEHYHRDGIDFLESFYRLADEAAWLDLTTVGDYLDRHPPTRTIETLHSGSWIFSDFTTWIGDRTKNRAWDLLTRAREAYLLRAEQGHPGLEAAREELLVAEGSDWFWWFGEGHDSGQDELFDFQFRLHLQNVYRLLGLTVPDELEHPVARPEPAVPTLPGLSRNPRFDGSFEAAADWVEAWAVETWSSQGVMHRSTAGIRRLLFGHNDREFLVRIEFADDHDPAPGDAVSLYVCYPGQPRINSPIPLPPRSEIGETAGYHFAHEIRYQWGEAVATISFAGERFTWVPIDLAAHVAPGEAVEIAIPLRALSVHPAQHLMVVAALEREGALHEVAPSDQGVVLKMPRTLYAVRAVDS